ncbi:hypothetical protein GCM10025792_37800 [Pseudonocardia tropica]
MNPQPPYPQHQFQHWAQPARRVSPWILLAAVLGSGLDVRRGTTPASGGGPVTLDLSNPTDQSSPRPRGWSLQVELGGRRVRSSPRPRWWSRAQECAHSAGLGRDQAAGRDVPSTASSRLAWHVGIV